MEDIGIRPIGRRIAVQLTKVEETQTQSGLVLPPADSADTYKAEVVVIGDCVEFVGPGDQVLLTIGAIQGAVFTHRQEQYAIVDERDILAVLDRG